MIKCPKILFHCKLVELFRKPLKLFPQCVKDTIESVLFELCPVKDCAVNLHIYVGNGQAVLPYNGLNFQEKGRSMALSKGGSWWRRWK